MKITNTFHCSPLSGTLSFNTCLIRRNAKNDRWDGKHKYPLCASCEQGQKIKAKFPDWKYKKNDKRKKPDRINLRKDKRKITSQVSLHNISAHRRGKVAENSKGD